MIFRPVSSFKLKPEVSKSAGKFCIQFTGLKSGHGTPSLEGFISATAGRGVLILGILSIDIKRYLYVRYRVNRRGSPGEILGIHVN